MADLYLEGSDQHRGWFQSSLLTSIAAKDQPPFGSVITHGFVLDEKGRKMSKSIGNVVDPISIIRGSDDNSLQPLGVDVLRLWVASSEYTHDIGVSKTILNHVSESMRKIRTTIRFLLGNLGDWDGKEISYQHMTAVRLSGTASSHQSVTDVKTDQFALMHLQQFTSKANHYYSQHAFNKGIFTVQTPVID